MIPHTSFHQTCVCFVLKSAHTHTDDFNLVSCIAHWTPCNTLAQRSRCTVTNTSSPVTVHYNLGKTILRALLVIANDLGLQNAVQVIKAKEVGKTCQSLAPASWTRSGKQAAQTRSGQQLRKTKYVRLWRMYSPIGGSCIINKLKLLTINFINSKLIN